MIDEEMGYELYKINSCTKNGLKGKFIDSVIIHDEYYIGISENKRMVKYGIATLKEGTYQVQNKNEVVYDAARIEYTLVNRKNQIVGNLKIYPKGNTADGKDTWHLSLNKNNYIIETKRN